ncbi:2,5-diamino-6-(ribosylamino)-4(3H)-pyrimidinone 5'-phosphate reductase [Methanolinea mesophila]|uniref:dihydrofolate reductase family protein n=1 Tax=Methanolinea mesophila TaxID=547055 RepID=UPI001AE65D17|nr:dihydrofolate reductase family protein [Methanolinea mesophila]MBP1928819.1 2,5-diamino-6-(ribosylamino)-4(3H)-pyrimidinone 5'-phosphate reductase [Methanolinea mesophila]
MIPEVIIHTAVSLDGRITNFPADLDLYYSLAAKWEPDAVLFGSETVLAAVRDNPALQVPPEHDAIFTPPEGAPDTRPLLVIADSRGRVRCWDAIRKWPYMRDVIAVCSENTPPEYRTYLAERKIGTIVAGQDRIDIRAALELLNGRYGVTKVRVDSGGTLNSVLLHAGVVTEVSVLIHPYLAGGRPEPTLFDPDRAGFKDFLVPLVHRSTEMMRNGIVWVRYAVTASCDAQDPERGVSVPDRP